MGSLRGTRASPPGLAATDERRRETYGAALHQFDELMQAAAAVSAVSRPMLLYYAMLQAGRAISAARTAGNGWTVNGHGLTQSTKDHAWRKDILKFRVKPADNAGILGAVADVIGSHSLTGGVEIGALWAALPEVEPPPRDDWPAAWPVYLGIHVTDEPQFMSTARLGYVSPRGVSHELVDPEEIVDRLGVYPDAAGAKLALSNGELQVRWTEWGAAFAVMWPPASVQAKYGTPIPAEVLDAHVIQRVPVYRRTGDHWLIPPVGENSDCLRPVLLWWVLMHGLSLLARYEPAAWRRALDLDKSQVADPLQRLLEDALAIVPDLMFHAMAGVS